MSIESQFPDLNDGNIFFPGLSEEDRTALHEALGILMERAGDDVLQAFRVLLGAQNKEYADQMTVPMRGVEATVAHVERECILAKMAVCGDMADMLENRDALFVILNHLYPRKD